MIDSAGEPHVMDFGLARREAGEVTMTAQGKVLGTLRYMSPASGGHPLDTPRTGSRMGLSVSHAGKNGNFCRASDRPGLCLRS